MNGSNNSTTFTDSSSFALSCSAQGNAKLSTAQVKYGSAAGYFDGSSYVRVPSSYMLVYGANNFTVECWIYPTSWAGYPNIWSQRYSGSVTIRITSSGYLQFFYGEGLGGITGSSQVALNAWSHIALTREGNTFKLWLNGSLVGTSSASSVDLSGSNAYVGASQTQSEPFYGYIDELRVTNYLARYTSSFTPPSAPFPDS